MEIPRHNLKDLDYSLAKSKIWAGEDGKYTRYSGLGPLGHLSDLSI